MKVITESNLMEFAWAIAESCSNTEEYFSFLFNKYAEEVYHAWTKEDIAEQAIKMLERKFPNNLSDLEDLRDYRDEIIEFLVNSEDFNIEVVADRFENFTKFDDPKELGVTWVNVEWAIAEVHTIEDLIAIVQEAIMEAQTNDDNVE